MADKQYAAPMSPPPNYVQPKPSEHHDAGPYYPPTIGSPVPGPYNQMAAYNNNEPIMRAPDPAYGGFYNHNPQGFQGPPAQGYYGPGMNQGGYYGQPGPMPPPQGMYYQQPPPGGYYYQDTRGGGSAASGICAGLLGALACCCCLDILF